MKTREGGGFFICTIQKFCDRVDDAIGLINERSNIICFSDEAHRTQLEGAKRIKFSKVGEKLTQDSNSLVACDNLDAKMQATLSKPYATVLREALPKPTRLSATRLTATQWTKPQPTELLSLSSTIHV